MISNSFDLQNKPNRELAEAVSMLLEVIDSFSLTSSVETIKQTLEANFPEMRNVLDVQLEPEIVSVVFSNLSLDYDVCNGGFVFNRLDLSGDIVASVTVQLENTLTLSKLTQGRQTLPCIYFTSEFGNAKLTDKFEGVSLFFFATEQPAVLMLTLQRLFFHWVKPPLNQPKLTLV